MIDTLSLKKNSNLFEAGVKEKKLLKTVAKKGNYYRHNPAKFVKEYLNIDLKLFQKILLYALMFNDYFMYVASRGQGKTYLVALFCVVRCILFPRTSIVVVSSTRTQANQVLLKIRDDFLKLHGWGSDLLKNEILKIHISDKEAYVKFKNHSTITVVTSNDNARGMRANIVVVDEFRMVDLNIIVTVLKKFLTTPRSPGFLKKKKYKHMIERNKEIYMSSAWLKVHWSYDKVKSYFVNMLDETKRYFVCGLPYQLSIKEELLIKEQIEDEMSEADFDEQKFNMEMGCIWLGESKDAFFSFEDIESCRILNKAIYTPELNDRFNIKDGVPDLLLNERRILSVDIALMQSTKNDNDASAIFINRALPKADNTYSANIIYSKNIEGLNTDELALIIRRLYKQYKCTDIVVDTLGVGLGVYDLLIKDMIDPETGKLYPALSCVNDEVMASRCKTSDAPKVIWSIKANANFNNEICLLLRSGFKNKKINLLVSELNIDDYLKDKINGYGNLTADDKLLLQMPYIQTTLTVYELVNLQHKVNGMNIKVVEKRGMRKDRYSSLAYNYWVQCELEREFLSVVTKNNEFDYSSLASVFKRLNKKPKTY